MCMLQAADRLFWAGVAMDVPACCSLAQKVDLYICLNGRGNEHLALVFAGCFFLERGNFIDFKRVH